MISRPWISTIRLIAKLSSKGRALAVRSSSWSVASRLPMRPQRPGVGAVGQRRFGARMGFHEHAGDAGRHRRARQHRHELALPAGHAGARPGSCTEWVASNTTGQPVARMTASERMSVIRLL